MSQPGNLGIASALSVATAATLCAVLVACGGAGSAATSQADAQAPNMTRRASSTTTSTATANEISNIPVADVAAAPGDAPQIVRWEQMSSSRVDRFTFEYRYRLHVRSAASHLKSGTLALSSAAAETTVSPGALSTGPLDGGRLYRLNDVVVIRQDRRVAFDLRNIHADFIGTVAGKSANANLQISRVDFLVPGGRPGHEGLFPLNTSQPQGGRAVTLRGYVFGGESRAIYRLLANDDKVLTQGTLQPNANNMSFRTAAITIPYEPFRIEIRASGTDGSAAEWVSSPYAPTAERLAVVPEKGAFEFGSPIRCEVVIEGLRAGAVRTVNLLLPAGFSAAKSAWTVVGTGVTQRLTVDLTTSKDGTSLRFYDLGATLQSTGTEEPLQASVTLFAR